MCFPLFKKLYGATLKGLDLIFSQRYIIKTSKVEKWAKESKLKKTSVLSLWEWQKEEQQFQRLRKYRLRGNVFQTAKRSGRPPKITSRDHHL